MGVILLGPTISVNRPSDLQFLRDLETIDTGTYLLAVQKVGANHYTMDGVIDAGPTRVPMCLERIICCAYQYQLPTDLPSGTSGDSSVI